MQVIIIEDEPTAVKKLEDILHEISPGIDILVTLPSAREAIAWISQNQAPDVGFFDIQLADDLSFQILDLLLLPFFNLLLLFSNHLPV